MKILCVIPARGGSKGVPRKNIKPLGGIPLIAYTIRAAQAAGANIDLIAVSTEDREIADVARPLGVRVVERPVELAGDDIKSEPVLTHALGVMEKETGDTFDGVLLLSPTNPFRDPKMIVEAIRKFSTGAYDTVVGLVAIPKYQYEIHGDRAIPLYRERKNRQERAPVFLENGALYLSRASLIRKGIIFGETLGYVLMDERSSINIDTLVDFLHAEAIVREREKQEFNES